MEEFLHLLQTEIEKPGVFSLFHLIALIPIIAGAILLPYFLKDTSEKVYKRVLFFSWITLIILEIFKQLVKSFQYGDPSYWKYSTRDFPFSLCSMIHYFLPIVIFFDRKKFPKIVDTAIGYLCLISLAAGVVVCIYSDLAVSKYIYVSIQTFIHHGSQVILGIFIYVWNRRNVTIKTFYRSMIAFVITAIVAIIINVLVSSFTSDFINMFFINPMIITNLPIGNVVQEKAGYPVFLIGYLSLIALVSYLTYLIETSIYKVLLKRNAKKAKA